MEALFAVACEEDCIDESLRRGVADSLRTNEEFGELMNHPNIEKKKNKLSRRHFAKDSKEIIGLMTLLSKRHAKDMCAVFEYFIRLVKEEKRIGSARVVTTIELSEEQKEKVEQKLLTQPLMSSSR
ncbi:MAG: F0F1 ATP synthase subunit delta [Roseburia sp.]